MRKITLARIEGLFHNISVDLNSILDEIPVGIIMLDQERRILLMNQVLEVLLGVSRSKVMGLPCLYVLRSRLCFENCPFLNPKKESESVISYPSTALSTGFKLDTISSLSFSEKTAGLPFIFLTVLSRATTTISSLGSYIFLAAQRNFI